MNDIELLNYLLECPSLSGEEGPYASLLANLLREEGFQVEIDSHSNVFAFDSEATEVTFSTHIDTVPPYFPPRREGSLIYGRGACDTKGGLVAMIMAARRLRKAGIKGLGFVLVVCEETTHVGAQVAIQHEVLKTRKPHFILCEPTNNRLVSAQKGMLKVTATALGKAAHSAYPSRGHSAIHDLIDFLYKVTHTDFPSDPILGPSTSNVGLISGGVAPNIFAPQASASIMIRTACPTSIIMKTLKDFAGTIELETVFANDPVHYDPPEGFDSCVVSFNTDASILNQIAPVWLVGPGSIEVAHSDHEHIDIEELRAGIDLYEELAKRALERRR